MLIFVDESEQYFSITEYEFAYKDRDCNIEKVVLTTSRVNDHNTVAIVDSNYSEIEIGISDIPKLIKALEAAHSKAFELRKD